MIATEVLQKAQFLVDTNGKKKAVVFDLATWEELLALLEDLEDAEEIRRLREAKEEAIPWEQAKAELRVAGIDV
jgi:PHD/YefM family antitoxin component YafN of YafNO toxin-antitoxin module